MRNKLDSALKVSVKYKTRAWQPNPAFDATKPDNYANQSRIRVDAEVAYSGLWMANVEQTEEQHGSWSAALVMKKDGTLDVVEFDAITVETNALE